MLKFMLDTNIYVIRRPPIEVLETCNKFAGTLLISVITYAELCHGVEKSALPEHNRRKIEDFVSRLEVLPYGKRAAAHYGDIRATLESQGKTIAVNDLHIAAHARSDGLVLVSNNLKEFERVSGLRLDNWL